MIHLPSPASHQQRSWDTDDRRKHTSRDWPVIDKTMEYVPLCTGQVKDKQINTVELGYNVMKMD